MNCNLMYGHFCVATMNRLTDELKPDVWGLLLCHFCMRTATKCAYMICNQMVEPNGQLQANG